MKSVLATVALSLVCLAWAGPARGQDQEGELRLISFAELNTLDPQKMSWLEDIRIARCLFETLVRIRLPEGDIEGGAAASWQVSADRTEYTFHLRPEARWSNGEAVTASDFIYAWRRALLPDLAADYTQLLFHIDGAADFFAWRSGQLKEYAGRGDRGPAAAAELWRQAQERFRDTVGLSAPDPRTLVVRLARPTPYFLELAAFATFMPVHEKSVSSQVSINPETGMLMQDPNWTKPERLVTNGPYTLARYRFKQDILLTANPHYWNRAAMGNRSILQLHIPDLQAALLAYQRGRADWIPGIPSTLATAADLAASGRGDVHVYRVAGTYFYNFNCQATLLDGRPNPLADARVRRALALGIDRVTLVRKVTRLNQPVARTFVPPDAIAGYAPPTEAGAEFDIAQARQLLAEAGYPEGRGLSGLSILYNTEGGHEAIAQQIKNAWEKNLGVVVGLEGVEKRIFGERLKNHDFTISRAAWIGDYRDPTTFLDKFITDNGNNDAAYASAEFDSLMGQAAREADAQRRFELLRRAEALMLADQPVAPIFHYLFVEMYDPARVRNLHSNPWGLRRLEFVEVGR